MGSLSQQETRKRLNPTRLRRAVGKQGLAGPTLATGWRCGPRHTGYRSFARDAVYIEPRLHPEARRESFMHKTLVWDADTQRKMHRVCRRDYFTRSPLG